MAHGGLAQVSALIGALGVALVILGRDWRPLLSGFALLAGAEAGLTIALVPAGDLRRIQAPIHLAAIGIGAVVVLGIAAKVVQRPSLAPLLLLVAAPFRIPVRLGGERAFLLVPLYVVLSAAVLALAYRAMRDRRRQQIPAVLAVPTAVYMALDSVSLVWSRDLKQGSIELVFFIFPFAALIAVVARTSFVEWLPRALAATLVTLSALFALIGLYQWRTHSLLYAPSLRVQNAYSSFFRVSSVFKDPSLYGRQLALTIAVLLVLYLLGRLRLRIAGPLIALLWAGLYLSYSQSSFVTLFVITVAIAVATADARARRLIAIGALGLAIATAGLVATQLQGTSVRRLTSDRSRLAAVTWPVFRQHPLVGVGVGAQPLVSHELAARRTAAQRNASHTTPLTVAAELGVAGLAAYLLFLVGAARLLLRLIARDRACGLAVGAVFVGLVLHSLFYAGFFEDPLTWGTLAVASAVTMRTTTTSSIPPEPYSPGPASIQKPKVPAA